MGIPDWVYVAQGILFEEMTKVFKVPFSIELRNDLNLWISSENSRIVLSYQSGVVQLLMDSNCVKVVNACDSFPKLWDFMQSIRSMYARKKMHTPDLTDILVMQDTLNYLLKDCGISFKKEGNILRLYSRYATDLEGGTAGVSGGKFYCSTYTFKCESADVADFLLQCRDKTVDAVLQSSKFMQWCRYNWGMPHLCLRDGVLGNELVDGSKAMAEAWKYFSIPMLYTRLKQGVGDRISAPDVEFHLVHHAFMPLLAELGLNVPKIVNSDIQVWSANRAVLLVRLSSRGAILSLAFSGVTAWKEDSHWKYDFSGSLDDTKAELVRIAKERKFNEHLVIAPGSNVECRWSADYFEGVLKELLEAKGFCGLKVQQISHGVVRFEDHRACVQYIMNDNGSVQMYVVEDGKQHIAETVPLQQIVEFCQGLGNGKYGYILSTRVFTLTKDQVNTLVSINLGYENPTFEHQGDGWRVFMTDIAVELDIFPIKKRYGMYLVTVILEGEVILEADGNIYDLENMFNNLRANGLALREGVLRFRVKASNGGIELRKQATAPSNVSFEAIDAVLDSPDLLKDWDEAVGDRVLGKDDKMVGMDSDFEDMLNVYEKEFGALNAKPVVEDEEEDFVSGWRSGNIDVGSIVPKEIGEARVVALIFDGKIFAYRFKTDVGDFDVTRMAAQKYGLAGYKVSKSIRLQLSNGIYATKSEVESGRLIPDVSENEEDCRRLFSVLFS